MSYIIVQTHLLSSHQVRKHLRHPHERAHGVSIQPTTESQSAGGHSLTHLKAAAELNNSFAFKTDKTYCSGQEQSTVTFFFS